MGLEANALTTKKMDRAKESVVKVQAVLIEAGKRGEDVDPEMLTGMFDAETIIHEYRRLYLVE